MTRVIGRRSVLARCAAAVTGLVAYGTGVSARQQSGTLTLTGDCSREAGVQLLVDWRAGLPVMRLEEMLPPLTWVQFSHPSVPWFYLIPPDWTPYVAWASSFSRTGVPVWEERQPQLPQLSMLRLVSPEKDAAYEQGIGNIQGQPLTVPQAAWVAQQSLLGESPELREICHYDESNPLAPGWGYADRYDQSVIVSLGNALGLPDPYLPATTVAYQTMFGPRDRYEELMRSVFIPILFQQLGGGSEPTPTPTPEF